MANVLHYETHGERGAPALMLIHALGSDLRFWEEVAPLLAPSAFCVTPDLRNAGKSPASPEPLDLDGHAHDLEALRAELGLEKIVVVGCAIGGMIAARYANLYPDRAAALVMTNPAVRQLPEVKVMLTDRAALVRREGMAVLLPKAIELTFEQMPRDARFQRFADRYAAQSAEAYAQSVLGFLEGDISEDIANAKIPILLMPGRHDVLMPPSSADELRGLAPHAELHPLENAAHFGPYQAPDEFSGIVRDFLARHKVIDA